MTTQPIPDEKLRELADILNEGANAIDIDGCPSQVGPSAETLREAASALLSAAKEIERAEKVIEFIAEEHDAGRHDGLPEPCPAHDAMTMWLAARAYDDHTASDEKEGVEYD